MSSQKMFHMVRSILSEQVEPEQQDKPSVPIDDIVEFFKDNPKVTDSQYHAWAEKKGLDVHNAEEVAYMMASKAAKFLHAGKARESGFTVKDADPEQLKMGIKVEMEHTICPKMAARIALDHLAEIKDYYTRLAKMEKEAGIED